MVMRILLGELFKNRGIGVNLNTVCTMNDVVLQKHAIEQVAKTKVIRTRVHYLKITRDNYWKLR